ncbi:MAG: PIG-L family deacetylase [Planctomycetota bacterium]
MTKSHEQVFENAAIIVAHPDDETLWAGGTILMHRQTSWTVITLCRKSDPDRSAKFGRAIKELNAAGAMGDLDDGPEQNSLDRCDVQNIILELLPLRKFGLIITHGPRGEYTRHLRHEETGAAVMTLWENGNLSAEQVWRFAYEDGRGKYLPRPVENADIKIRLSDEIWQKKYDIITGTYGFAADSFEARVTPRQEAFLCLRRS